jgi:uncharacterized membrane protein HdeD (DUF308 family)
MNVLALFFGLAGAITIAAALRQWRRNSGSRGC